MAAHALVPQTAEHLAFGGRRFKLAICNEAFQGTGFAEGCKLALATGYAGLEIATWKLSEDLASLPTERHREFRAAIVQTGVACVGPTAC